MNDMPLPDPLNEFLANPPANPASPGLRDDLLGRTSAVIRERRRRRRVFLTAASLAAALLLVALGLWALSRPIPDVRPRPDNPPADVPVLAQAKPGPGPQ